MTNLPSSFKRSLLSLGVGALWLLLVGVHVSALPLGKLGYALVYVPIVATALLWGVRAGLLSALLGTGVNALLLEPSVYPLALNALLSLVSGAFAGYLRNLQSLVRAQRRELTLRDDQLEYHTYRDPLTGLYNRERFEAEFEARAGEDSFFALFLIDLDDFKQLNDSFGQAVGDALLRQVALRLNTYAASEDLLARLSGDEFILLTSVERFGQAGGYALRLLDHFREPFTLHGETFFIRASVGISFFPRDGDNLDTLLRAADSAMYRVKRRGKSSYESYSPTSHEGLNERFDLEYKLRDAIECEELELFYQPQVDVQSGKLWGLEALLRWHHPDLGLLSPDRFIDIAEYTGMIVPIGAWVLEQACRQQRSWQDAGCAPSRIAVNVSTVQFSHPDFLSVVTNALSSSGLDPSALELEVTEGALMKNMASAISTLQTLRDMGVNLAIDDFGVGYSSLSYLQKLPVNTLKIDRSFMPEFSSREELEGDLTLIRAIIGLAHGLGKTVIAEGVEHEMHLEYLRHLDCEYAQGYYFGKPISSHDIQLVLSAFAWNIQQPTKPSVKTTVMTPLLIEEHGLSA